MPNNLYCKNDKEKDCENISSENGELFLDTAMDFAARFPAFTLKCLKEENDSKEISTDKIDEYF